MTLPITSLRSLPKSPPPKPKRKRPSTGKRKRGGQPGNNNARKLGVFSVQNPSSLGRLRLQISSLSASLQNRNTSPSKTLEQTEPLFEQLDKELFKTKDAKEYLALMRLMIKALKLRESARVSFRPHILKHRALEAIAQDPFGYFESHYKNQGMSRDADSFFPVSNLSARNSPHCASDSPLQIGSSILGADGIPPDHPNYATNLTDEQWAILAPLIPPSPAEDWLLGDPPVMIAASRWCFTPYFPTGEFNDFVIMQNYYEIRQRYPALLNSPPQPVSPLKRRGRPRNRLSPRALLDAIIWKLATGHNWDALPFDFPPKHACRKYYQRLFIGGRLYTILRALYLHMRLEGKTDPELLLEEGVFTTTASQHIALSPGVQQTWQNYSALLFMQLAREAYSYFEKEQKRKNPLHLKFPVFKGTGSLSTAELSASTSTPSFTPLEESLVGRKMRKIERDRKTIDRIVARHTK